MGMEVSMNVTDAVIDHVLEEAHDPDMGARPLKRYLERHLVSRLSTLILKDELTPGSSIVADWVTKDGDEQGDWDFRITQMPKPEVETDESMARTSSATLGRAGRSSPTYVKKTQK